MSRPFCPDDFFHYHALGQVECCRTRDEVAFVVRTIDASADGYHAALWSCGVDASAPRRLTQGPPDAFCPRWSPDGETLAFLSARDAPMAQVHLLSRSGGEARQLTHCAQGVVDASWSPDGSRLLLSVPVLVDPDSRDEAKVRKEGWPANAPELAWRVPYKTDGVGYLLHRRIQLFVADAVNGEIRSITAGDFDVLGSAWSPDGSSVAMIRTRSGRAAHCTELWIAGADGGELRHLSSPLATAQSPAWSPDGRHIAFFGAEREGDPRCPLWITHLDGGDLRCVSNGEMELVATCGAHWSGDSQAITLVEAANGAHRIVQIGVASGGCDVLVEGGHQYAGLAVSGQRLFALAEGLTEPCELYAFDRDGRNGRRLTDFNAWWRGRAAMRGERRRFSVPDGRGGTESVEGWLLRAEGASGPQPLLVDAHGGPTSYAMLGYPWHTHWYVLASRGWAVLALNPAGSTGYGADFAERLKGHWGELDFPQHLAAVEALQREGVADERVAISGKSYGGYMAAWAVGHSRTFRAAIVSAPVTNLESHFGTSDGGYYYDPYTLEAEKHIDPERYRALSPLQHAHNALTPTLILQGKEDQRCPRGQAEELFAVLVRCSRAPAELVLYPLGDHHFYEQGLPSHRLDVVERSLAWLERWIDVPLPPA
jgi:dipeptidyl aminopeptidase/acylaminoacyl peptidase